ncbi:MAG: hypothetical protein OXU40_07060 [Nitrospira sp.]|nr:hypothetical protein [Nitrospira sp.]
MSMSRCIPLTVILGHLPPSFLRTQESRESNRAAIAGCQGQAFILLIRSDGEPGEL